MSDQEANRNQGPDREANRNQGPDREANRNQVRDREAIQNHDRDSEATPNKDLKSLNSCFVEWERLKKLCPLTMAALHQSHRENCRDCLVRI